MDINRPGRRIVWKGERSVVSSEKSHWSIGLSIVLEGKGGSYGAVELARRSTFLSVDDGCGR